MMVDFEAKIPWTRFDNFAAHTEELTTFYAGQI